MKGDCFDYRNGDKLILIFVQINCTKVNLVEPPSIASISILIYCLLSHFKEKQRRFQIYTLYHDDRNKSSICKRTVHAL